MMRGEILIICAALLAFATSQDSINDAFAQQMRLFSGELYTSALAEAESKTSNLIYSPLSVYETLGMVLAGSQGNTTKELLRGMEITQGELPGVDESLVHGLMYSLRAGLNEERTGQILLVANAMFVHQAFTLKDTYLGTLTGKYDAHYQSLDLTNSREASRIINQWISDNTQGRIQDLIETINPFTRVILTNAVYFNASWKNAFSEARMMNYTLPDGTVVKREAMTLTGTFLHTFDRQTTMNFLAIPYASSTPYTSYFVVGLPLADNNLTIFDPMAGKTLRSLPDLSKWQNGTFRLQLPKFEIATDLNLKPILQGLGITEIFNEERSNLAGISNAQLHVSEFAHKASVTVNEEGTEASAATMANVDERMGSFVQGFTVNRPFFFGIYNEQAKIFTFLGKIYDPGQQA